MKLVTAALCLLGMPSWAQDLPTVFDVTGVAANDVLNVRAAPDASADIMGVFAHDAKAIEVVAFDESRRWGRVNATGETAGWVAMRFLKETAPGVTYPTDFARDLWCAGAEPFWLLSNTPEGVVSWDMAGEEMLTLTRMFASPARNRGRYQQVMVAAGDDRRITMSLHQEICSDGMSDAVFGFEAQVLVEYGAEPYFVTGCCSLSDPGR